MKERAIRHKQREKGDGVSIRMHLNVLIEHCSVTVMCFPPSTYILSRTCVCEVDRRVVSAVRQAAGMIGIAGKKGGENIKAAAGVGVTLIFIAPTEQTALAILEKARHA